MPNWCSNRVEVYGDDEEIKVWKDLVESKESKFDFNKIIPMPKELEDTTKGSNHVVSEELIEKYGYDNWYDWSVNSWGTKWNIHADEIEVEDSGEQIVYHFSTAWSPPQGIYNELRGKFPDLSLTWFYDEPGMQFAGYL